MGDRARLAPKMRAQKVSTHSGTGPPVPDHVKRPPAAGGVAGVASNMPGLRSSTERRRSVELDLDKKVSRDKRMLEVLNSRVGLPNAKAEDGKEWLGGPGERPSGGGMRARALHSRDLARARACAARPAHDHLRELAD